MPQSLDGPDEIALVARVQRGDRAALDALTGLYYKRLLAVATRGCRGFGSGEEYLGLAFQWFHERILRYKPMKGASIWTFCSRGMAGEIARICYRQSGVITVPRQSANASQRIRELGRRAKNPTTTHVERRESDDTHQRGWEPPAPLNGTARRDEREWIAFHARGMERHDRLALMMTLDGHTQNEIGRTIGISSSAVSHCLQRSMRFMRERAALEDRERT